MRNSFFRIVMSAGKFKLEYCRKTGIEIRIEDCGSFFSRNQAEEAQRKLEILDEADRIVAMNNLRKYGVFNG